VVVKLENLPSAPAAGAFVLSALYRGVNSADADIRDSANGAFDQWGLPVPWGHEFLQRRPASALSFAALTLPFALLHFFLYAFDRRGKVNLFYALFTIFAGASGCLGSLSLLRTGEIFSLELFLAFVLSVVFAQVLGMRLVYGLLGRDVPRRWLG